MRFVILVLFLLVSVRVLAVPVEIASCVSNGHCVVRPSGAAFHGPTSSLIPIYSLFRFDGGPVQKILVEYNLGTASVNNLSGEVSDPETGAYAWLSIANAISGKLWLELPVNYSTGEDFHKVTLHFDQVLNENDRWSGVAPYIWEAPYGYPNNYNSSVLNMHMSTAALLGGSGAAMSSCCRDEDPIPTLFGDPPESFHFLCLADGCYNTTELNLLGLQVTQAGGLLTVAPRSDPETRSTVFFSDQGYEGGESYHYSLSPVPVPAAAWLMVSGLLAVFGVSRRASPA